MANNVTIFRLEGIVQYLNYNECKQRGRFDFPIEYYHVENTHPQYIMPFHWHVEYEIIRILKGSFIISLDEEEIKAKSGDVIFIPGGTLHACTPTNCIYECVVFDMRMLLDKDGITRRYIELIDDQTLRINPILTCEGTRLHDTIWRLFDSFCKETMGYEMIVKGTLYEIFGTLLERNLFNHTSFVPLGNQRRINQLKHALELIEEQYSTTITLKQLSKAAGMSSKYFCKFFQDMTHKSPMNYLNFYRIERACYQLIHSDSSIIEISMNCGFNDVSYFIKTFRKYKGTTPSKYRKQIR